MYPSAVNFRRHTTGALGVVGAALIALFGHACSSDASGVRGAADDGGADAMNGRGLDAAGDSGPLRAPFGIDTRPPNTTCLAGARPSSSTNVMFVDAFPLLPGVSAFVGSYQAPGDTTHWYGMSLNGVIQQFDNTPTAAELRPFLDLGAEVHVDLEGGLLGFAFHPQWATNRTAFVSYTTGPAGTDAITESVVSRVRSTDGGLTLDPSTEEVLLRVPRNFYGHNGGNLAFGPDGYLYGALGDDGPEDDPDNNGQRRDTLFAKIYRLEVGATGPYKIPADNPFASGGGRAEIFAFGLRNPWRFSFDRATGALWVGDVGQNQWEEVDVVERGGNYGWRVREGSHCRPPAVPPCDGDGTLIDPVIDYEHDLGFGGPGSITGGYVYRGSAMPELRGTYVFADFAIGGVYFVEENAATGGHAIRKVLDTPFLVASFAEGADGEIYALSFVEGRMMKLAKASATQTNAMPEKLSQTGCFDATDATKPLAALIPYDINAPFWSDGATKRRWMALPDGKTATVDPASGHLDLPIGSVLAKEFRIGQTRIETRLFVRHDDGGWAGYSYAWNAGGTDATLLPAAATKQVGTDVWSFPGRGQCLQCHTAAAGRSLGTEVAQLRRDVVYDATNRIAPQLDTLEHIGVVSGAAQAAAIPALVDPAGAAPVDARARSYLHTNCASCHRPGALVRTKMDLRANVAFKGTSTCNVSPVTGTFGVADGKLIAPGDPSKSLLLKRMSTKDAYRMPPIGRNVVDQAGASLLGGWIGGLTSCPP